MSARTVVYITENFEHNLDSIELYFLEHDIPLVFSDLVENLLENIIPNLQRFPAMGLNFISRKPGSVEGTLNLEKLHEELDDKFDVREYISGEYLILYALNRNSVYLLSIKHHRQLSFNLDVYLDS